MPLGFHIPFQIFKNQVEPKMLGKTKISYNVEKGNHRTFANHIQRVLNALIEVILRRVFKLLHFWA